MNARQALWRFFACAAAATTVLLAACVMMSPVKGVNVTLTGNEEVPPVSTPATGSGSFMVASNRTVSGNITTTGLNGVAAHIHIGARGENGPIAIGLVQTAGAIWAVPAGTKFTDEQYAAFTEGRTYVNVHTAAHKGGEIRAQLLP